MGLAGTIDPTVYDGLRSVLQRSPLVVTVTYQPDSIEKRYLRAEIAPDRLVPPTGPDAPVLDVEWRFTEQEAQYRIHYADPNTGVSCGWHRDADHPELGAVHFQYAIDDDVQHEQASFPETVPTEILWTAMERLFNDRLPELTS